MADRSSSNNAPTTFEEVEALDSYKESFCLLHNRKRPVQSKRDFLMRFKDADFAVLYPAGPLLNLSTAIVDELNKISLSKRAKDWNSFYCAKILARLHSIFVFSQNSQRPLRVTHARAQTIRILKDLKSFLDEITSELDHDKSVKANQGRRRGLSQQKTGERVQDRVPWDPSKQEVQPCPNPDCGHSFCMAIETEEEVLDKNAKVEEAYQKRLREWTSKPESEKGPKPRRGTFSCQTIACYCSKMHCLLRLDGGQCPMCRKLVNTEQTPHDFDENNELYCKCSVCACTCQVTFPRNKRAAIALELEMEKRGMNKDGEQENSANFLSTILHGIMDNSVIEAARESNCGVDKVSVNDAASMASLSVLKSTELNHNTVLRNNLRNEIPRARHINANGMKIGTLRDTVRMSTNLSTQTSSSQAFRNRDHCSNGRRDSKFYRNGLSGSRPIEGVASTNCCNHVSPTPFSSPKKRQKCSQFQSPTKMSDLNDEVEIVETRKPAVPPTSTPSMEKRLRRKVARKIAKEGKIMDDDDLLMCRKIQKNLVKKDRHTSTILADADLPNSQEALDYLSSALSPPTKK